MITHEDAGKAFAHLNKILGEVGKPVKNSRAYRMRGDQVVQWPEFDKKTGYMATLVRTSYDELEFTLHHEKGEGEDISACEIFLVEPDLPSFFAVLNREIKQALKYIDADLREAAQKYDLCKSMAAALKKLSKR